MSITIEQLEQMAAEIARQRECVEKIKKEKQAQDKILDELELKFIEALRECGKEKYQSEVGTLYTSHRLSYRVPKTPEQRASFFEYLKQNGDFDNLITVNSQTLNSYCKEKFELAKQAGAEDFEIPGLEPPEVCEVLGFRKT